LGFFLRESPPVRVDLGGHSNEKISDSLYNGLSRYLPRRASTFHQLKLFSFKNGFGVYPERRDYQGGVLLEDKKSGKHLLLKA
jgi:hypothetical protein